MHTVIYAIVPATTAKEAIDSARHIFNRLTENQQPFDYYQMFDTEGSSVSGKGRWGNIPVALQCKSPEGKKMIEEAWNGQREEFLRNIKSLRKAVEKYSDADLFAAKFDKSDTDTLETPRMFRYVCHSLGQYEGPEIALYDGDGCGITDAEYLDKFLQDKDMWIVPADVHF